MDTMMKLRVGIKSYTIIILLLALVLPLVSASVIIEETGSNVTDVDGIFANIYSNRAEFASLDDSGTKLTLGDLETDTTLSPVLFVLFLLGVIGLGLGLVNNVFEKSIPLSGRFATSLAFIGNSALLALSYSNISTLIAASELESDGRYLFTQETVGGSSFSVYVNGSYNLTFWLLLLGTLLMLLLPVLSKFISENQELT